MGRAITLFNWVGAVTLAAASFYYLSDRTWSAALHWAIFYAAAIGVPFWWSSRVTRELARLERPVSPGLRRAAYYPVLAGLLTMLLALSLIARARS